MLGLLFGLYVWHIIRKIYSGNLSWHCLGCGNDKPEPASIKYTQPPEYQQQMDLFNAIQDPYMKSQFKLYTDMFEPLARSTGAATSANLADPYALPEGWQDAMFPQDYWDKTWQQAREKSMAEYAPIEQRTSQRLAASGGLEGGPAQSLFKDIELSKAKSIESLAINQAINQFKEMKDAKANAYALKQNAISNAFGYLQMQPQFNIPMPSSQSVIDPGKAGHSGAAKAWSIIAPYSGLSDIAGNVSTGGDYGNVNWLGGAGTGEYY